MGVAQRHVEPGGERRHAASSAVIVGQVGSVCRCRKSTTRSTRQGIRYEKYEHPPVFTSEEADEALARRFPRRAVKNLFLRNKKGDRGVPGDPRRSTSGRTCGSS